MHIDYFEKLSQIAAEMDRTRASSGAGLRYDMFTVSLWWSDEYPTVASHRREDFDCVKLLIRYRMTLLLGIPDESLRPYWDHARSLFPNWAGFHPNRLVLTPDLKSQYERWKEEDERSIEELEAEAAQDKLANDAEPT